MVYGILALVIFFNPETLEGLGFGVWGLRPGLMIFEPPPNLETLFLGGVHA